MKASTGSRLKAAVVELLPDPVVFRLAPLLYRRQEPELARMRDYVPRGRNAIDVGAWLGPWTRELARWVPHVTCIEPQPDLAAYLRKVVPANVTVREVAVSDAAGRARLAVPSAQHGANALAALVGDGASAGSDALVHEVEVIRLDDLEVSDVGFVKIDVEGHEQGVLEGAVSLIRRDLPRLLLEAEQRHLDTPLSELFERVLSEGYTGWFLQGGAWHPLEEFDVQRHQLDHLDDVVGPDYINNVLFLPEGEGPP